jgi:hypothetical protein
MKIIYVRSLCLPCKRYTMISIAIHKINKHSCIGNRIRRYRKQTGNINPHPLRRSRITYNSIFAYHWAHNATYVVEHFFSQLRTFTNLRRKLCGGEKKIYSQLSKAINWVFLLVSMSSIDANDVCGIVELSCV